MKNDAPPLPSVFFDELGAGMTIGPLTRTDFVRFAGAGGDFNPVHHDEVYARGLGYPSVLAMGLFTASVAARLFETWPLGQALKEYSVRFLAPVWPGEELVIRAHVAGAAGQGSATRRVAVSVANLAGEWKMKGEAHTGALPSIGGDAPSDKPGMVPPALAGVAEDVLAARIGEIVRTVRFPVEAGKVREFARAIGATSGVYADQEAARQAGYADVPCPPTFTIVAPMYACGEAIELPGRLGLDLNRVVHGEQAWIYHRTPVVGEVLQGETRLSNVGARMSAARQPLRIVTVETKFTDLHGRPVIDERMVMVEKPPGRGGMAG